MKIRLPEAYRGPIETPYLVGVAVSVLDNICVSIATARSAVTIHTLIMIDGYVIELTLPVSDVILL